ncbi:MAG: hypothetical protein AB7F86_19830 [Bdellovibrionales bacterium]
MCGGSAFRWLLVGPTFFYSSLVWSEPPAVTASDVPVEQRTDFTVRPDQYAIPSGLGEKLKGCSASVNDISDFTDQYVQRVKSQGTRSHTRYVDACHETMKKFVNACGMREIQSSAECTLASAPKPGSGLAGAFDRDIASHVHQSNCRKAIGSCLTNGSTLKGMPSWDELWRICEGNLLPKMKELEPQGYTADAQNERQAIYDARVYMATVRKLLLDPAANCEKRRADQDLKLARERLEKSKAVRSDGKPQTIDCLDRQSSYQFCYYSYDGARKLEPLAEAGDYSSPVNLPGNDAPARLANGCSGACFRAPSSIGATECLTAGHCMDETNSGSSRMVVYDSEGRPQVVKSEGCRGVYENGLTADYAICRIEGSVNTKPMYLATMDTSVTGDSCRDEGYVMRCGPGFYERIAREQVKLSATIFPAGGRMSFTQGQLFYDSANKQIYHDLLTARGASGSGLVVNYQGRNIVMGAHSWSYERTLYGGGTIISYEEYQRLRVREVEEQRLSSAEQVMLAMLSAAG